MSGIAHLARRFFWSLKPAEVEPSDIDWVRSVLSGPEFALFEKLSGHDQVHSVAVARKVIDRLEVSDRDWVVSAALLHDIGKVESGAGVAGRVAAAILDPVVPEGIAIRLAGLPGWFGRVGAHLRYTDLGASLLGSVGSDPRVRAWALEHHEPPSGWSIPADLGRALQAADDCATSDTR